MQKEKFYNRIHETRHLVEIITSAKPNNKIIVLAGPTGIGKSAFINKVLSNELSNHSSIHVSICRRNPDTIENLYYFNAFYRALVNFITNRKRNSLHFDPSVLKNFVAMSVDIFLDKTIGEGHTLYEPIDEKSILNKKRYIIEALRKNAFIISIDNIQNIDAQSLEILKDILEHISNTIFILEYTIEQRQPTDILMAFYNDLNSFNAIVNFFELQQLEYSEACKLAPNGLSEAELHRLYEESNGNLVNILLAAKGIDTRLDPITYRLNELSKDERFLVNLLLLNESPLRYMDLCRMILGNFSAPPFSEKTLYNCLVGLSAKRIISFFNVDEIKIYHDSIISQLNSQLPSAILYSAYSVIRAFYCKKLSVNPAEETVIHLFCLYLRFSDSELLTILPQVNNLLRSFKYPKSAIKRLVYFREKVSETHNLSPNLYRKLVMSLTNICTEYGLVEEALKNLALIYSPDNSYHRALKAAILSLDFVNSDSIKKVRDLVQQADTPRERLTSELCLLSAEMACKPREYSLKMVHQMLAVSEYKNYLEYGFLLSNYAELINDAKKCIDLYREAVSIFHSKHHDEFAANILVFLSMVYAYQGEIQNARKALKLATVYGNVRESYILNNNAVLDILEGKASAEDVEQLRDALLLASDPYDKTLIRCNLLVCYTYLSEYGRAEQIACEITSQPYEQFRYEEFLHIVYQDLYYYTKSVGKSKEANLYKLKLQELIANASEDAMFLPIANLQFNDQVSPSIFFSRFPFRVDFIGSWSLEVSPELENF